MSERQVATDALKTLGTIIGAEEKRDAIHLAVDPVIAYQRLDPGEHVGFLPDGRVGHCGSPVGIVDPFLRGPVKEGERFWLVVYPRQITSLRHVWSHPAFKDEEDVAPASPDKAASEKWLRDFARGADVPGYEEMIQAAIYGGGDYVGFGTAASGEIPEEFWGHVENVTGHKFPAGERATYFSCAC